MNKTNNSNNIQKRRKVKKNKMNIETLMGILFILTLFLFISLNIITPDKEISQKEKRFLEQKPVLNITNLRDGTYMKKFENFLSDQFAFRDFYIQLNSKTELLLGNKESNGIYYGKNDYLFEKPSSFSEYDIKNREAIKIFSEKHKDLNTYMMIVPNSISILNEYLPNFLPIENQLEQIEDWKNYLGDSLNFIDLYYTMKSNSDKYIYYRTDHHWTTLGAYYAFQKFADIANINYSFENYQDYPVKNNFSGTLEAKSGFDVKDDIINVFVPKEIEKLIVTDIETGEISASLYDSKNLFSDEPYAVFMGGNRPIIEIKTLSESNRNLIIFKDSYANSFIPFATPYFNSIYIVDPRYYYGNIENIINDKKITDILFLYNANTLFKDSSIYQILQ